MASGAVLHYALIQVTKSIRNDKNELREIGLPNSKRTKYYRVFPQNNP